MPLTLDRVAKARCTRVPARCAIFALALAVAACGLRELPPPEVAKRLVVAVRPGPAAWFPGSTGDAQGFDHDLVERYARDRSLALEIHLVHDAPTALARGKYAMAAIEAMTFDESIAFLEGQIGLQALTEDAKEGMAAFREKRTPNWPGR